MTPLHTVCININSSALSSSPKGYYIELTTDVCTRNGRLRPSKHKEEILEGIYETEEDAMKAFERYIDENLTEGQPVDVNTDGKERRIWWRSGAMELLRNLPNHDQVMYSAMIYRH